MELLKKQAAKIVVNYDGPLTIAVGRSRKETQWKNKEMRWSELVDRLSKTTQTRETVQEYRKLAKPAQDDIKDVGGFVGGTLKGGRRKADAVSWRQLLTLDADFADRGLWDTIELIMDYAVVLYSTHKHTPEAPRVRLVIPLSRPVTADEYAAVSRRVAADIGIDYFDDTTYEPCRLMYWPSTPDDGEFLFKHQDGPWLDPDTILARYDDWRDPFGWPESSRTQQVRKKMAEKQGDPLTKPGLIGAFNRAYTIPEAIDKFLSDIYTACDLQGRYTYTAGSTAGGLVLYEDEHFAYSHHSTDPAGGKLCNAFDLVRIHKFGELDEEVPEGHPSNRLPSYLAMTELAGGDPQTRVDLLATKTEDAVAEFGAEPVTEAGSSWKEDLDYNSKGALVPSISNAVTILDHDPRMAGRIRFNEFASRYEIIQDLPWKKAPSVWSDNDDAALRYYLEKAFGLVSPAKIADAVAVVLEKHKYHPVRDYLDGLTWDGEPRLDTLLADWIGVEDDSDYVRTVIRKALTAAVARIYKPGIKYDYMLVIRGPQGIGKSMLLKKLAGSWVQETMTTVEGKEACEQLRGFWLVEMGELSATRKADNEAIKLFLSRQTDTYRVPYGKRLSEFPRQCVFIGTTNSPTYLSDPSGNRRYWPVTVTGINQKRGPWYAMTQDYVDQVWAEAVFRFRAGESLYLDDKKLADEAILQQMAVRRESEKVGMIGLYLDRLLPEGWENWDLPQRRSWLAGYDMADELIEGTVKRDRVCVMEIWAECFGGDPGKIKRIEADEIHDIMMELPGWERYEKAGGKLRFGKIYGVQRGYVRAGERNKEMWDRAFSINKPVADG